MVSNHVTSNFQEGWTSVLLFSLVTSNDDRNDDHNDDHNDDEEDDCDRER